MDNNAKDSCLKTIFLHEKEGFTYYLLHINNILYTFAQLI